jgi:hypothetical protein
MTANPAFAIVVAGAIARLSAVLLVTFGLKILLNLYSYHIRLAVFYAARIDALRILDNGSLDDLEQLVRILSPENITFDKPPEAPDVSEIVKVLLGAKKD